MRLGSLPSLRLAVPYRQIRRRVPFKTSRNALASRPGSRVRFNRLLQRVSAEETKGNGSLNQPVPFEFEELTDLIRMVNESDIVDFEIENKGISLSIKKAEALEEKIQVVQGAVAPSPPVPSFSGPVPAAEPAPVPQSAPPPPTAPSPAPQKEENAVPEGMQIVSPMSGCFYAAPAPGEPVFVKEGDKVSAGQTVCIIEAMKLMNEIEAEISGEVVKILAQNGQSITAGQALIVLKPV